MQKAPANVCLGGIGGLILNHREALGSHLSRGLPLRSMDVLPWRHFPKRLICPTGRLAGPRVQPCFQKYLSFHLSQITGLSRAIPFPIEGRFAIVTDVGFGMRWTRQRRRTPMACGRAMRRRTAKSCGPDAPTLASSERQCFRIALAMVATKPGHQGEHEGNR